MSGIVRVFLLAVIIWLSSMPATAAVFLIDAPESDTMQARLALEYYHDRIAGNLEIEFPDTVRVVIAANREAFNRAVGSYFPDWGAAAAIKKKNRIVIKSPSHFKVGKSLNELLGHELGHLMLDKASGGKWLPRWFEEGFCQLVSGEWRLKNDIAVTRAVWGSGLIPLTALEKVNQFNGSKASLAYAQSYLAVSLLVQEFGMDVIPHFLSTYRDSGDIFGAFFKASGYRYSEWIDFWKKNTEHRYKLVLFVFESDFFFPALAVLFILLYIVKKYQVRKKKQKWEVEERYKGNDQIHPT